MCLKKVLIANRGEIAARIIKTCKKLGIETVAIYSDADQDLPYVKDATISYRIGESPVTKSYLLIDKILEIAAKEQVDAIHPGYGFLSENSDFAKAVKECGIEFIGPSPETISLMGDKVRARQKMQEAGIPVVPGSDSGIRTLQEACAFASRIGYPIMLKAAGGGGGIGMTLCNNETDLKKVYQSTKIRAKTYFGNDEVFIEKFVVNARHIEVQIFGDRFGNIVHLYERDCSIQRRNQKVIEETPSPFISKQTRDHICQTAINAAKGVNYTNAGTIEFVVDEQENFYFLEMNTRLQVEHPITEMITNIDLVEWQLLVAEGKSIPKKQSEIESNGHSIEFRLYAEDPVTFMPSPGKLTQFHFTNHPNVRMDAGYETGSTVTPYYDPMLAKIIITSMDRKDSLRIALDFFREMQVEGIKTNIPLFIKILENESFQKGSYTTKFLSTIYE